MAQVEPDFQAALAVCGLTWSDQLRNSLLLEGLTSFQNMASLNSRDIDSMAKNMTARNLNQGGFRIGTVHVKHLKALNFWIRDLQRQQLPVPQEGFTAADLADSLARLEIETATEEVPVKDPPKFTGDNWVDWCPAMINKLASLRGSSGISLDYIVRNPDLTVDDFAEGERDRRIYAAPLEGPNFDADNLRVSQELVSQLASTPGQTWMDMHPNNGRQQWLKLFGHFEGQGYKSARYNMAMTMLANLHYVNEQSFPFHAYIAGLSRAFTHCEKAKLPLYPSQKVKYLVKGIKVDALKPAVEVALEKYPENFSEASAHLSARVSDLFAVAQQRRSNNKRSRSVSRVDSSRRGRGRGGRGRGNYQGGRSEGGRGGGRGNNNGGGRGERYLFNGVDITNPHRRFSNNEMNRLGREGQRVMFERRRAIPDTNNPRTIAAAITRISALEQQLAHAPAGRELNQTQEAAQQQPPPATGRGAGAGFGRGAYRGRRRSDSED
jgi:hypothetical protein